MPRITKVYTRKGDDGTTCLGRGQRVAKDDHRVAAYGAVDELGSHLGVALTGDLADELIAPLMRIQNDLFHLGSDLCILEDDKRNVAVPTIEQSHVDGLEKTMDALQASLSPLENFILPGGTRGAALLHVARSACRRAEREVVTLARLDSVGSHVVPYLNRLSDALFVMARYENRKHGKGDILWDRRA